MKDNKEKHVEKPKAMATIVDTILVIYMIVHKEMG